jgi:hypothetical protein
VEARLAAPNGILKKFRPNSPDNFVILFREQSSTSLNKIEFFGA